VVVDPADAERKALLLAQADAALEDAKLLGDLVVGAALSRQDDADALASPGVAAQIRTLLRADGDSVEYDTARALLRDLADDWLVETRPAVGEIEEVTWADRDPFHWALEFPEVRAQRGFDAIVGNPPFQGGTLISGALGNDYRHFLARWLAKRSSGRGDLVAFFFLRASHLIRAAGGFGLIATNTIAQGDTREVGLDQLVANSSVLHRAVASEPWPGGAKLEMSTVWMYGAGWDGRRSLNGNEVSGITSALTLEGRVPGQAFRLATRPKVSFEGSKPYGQGFVLEPKDAELLIAEDPRNAEVVMPYLNGEDLNQRPDASPSRWAINFRDWSEDRAREFVGPFKLVEQRVKPERSLRDADRYPQLVNEWWVFWRTRLELYRALEDLDRCLAIALTSKVVLPLISPTDIVFSHATAVFAYDDPGHFGLLSSAIHREWAIERASTMRNDIRYTPTDCFETFVQPELTQAVSELGGRLDTHRSALMLNRQEGLTTTYNRVHDPDEMADDIVELREIHVALDYAVRDAYGWTDLELGHDFHPTKFGTRFTFASVPRQEVLDRLMELNHERYAEEVRQGLHSKSKAKARPATQASLSFDVGDA
jgi:hypothetical protein